ncbi:MAG: class I SAM-dependent methyltransferase [Anaerolineae bacterium]|nr:class I SAM-dependent methyltransferase [Anaerolineae bacterium]
MADSMRSYFEARAPVWNRQVSAQTDARLRAMLASFDADLCSARTILDVGTGVGILIPYLREFAPSARLIATDLAHAMLAQARLDHAGAWVVQADVHDQPLAVGGFDVVICHHSFPHFTDKPLALREMGRVLRPGGLLAILHHESRATINAIHAGCEPPVDADVLPDADEMGVLLAAAGYIDVRVDDAPDRYIAAGRRMS